MCGVAVFCPPDPVALTETLREMRDRGPDRTGSVVLPTAALGVTRLAITGVEHGHQPIAAPGNAGAVGFNGAIYNAPALMQRYGPGRVTGNDGDVIWPLYEAHGLDFGYEIDGMYAIALVDEARERVVLAVDPYGVKSLYLAAADGAWVAASTVRAIPARLRQHVVRVPAGTVVTSDGDVRHIDPRVTVKGSLRQVLEASVAEKIPAEVRWACLLSGGVDSSLATALAARNHPGVTTTISVGLAGCDDLAAAAQVATVLGTDHHEVLVHEDELPSLIDLVIRETASPDVSVVMGGVGTYLAARAARRLGAKVVLGGDGADELFGGYSEYRTTPPHLLQAEMDSDVADLAGIDFRRFDATTGLAGVEGRPALVSPSVVACARALPLTDKLDLTLAAEPRDKGALRRVAAEVLPASIAWRQKAGFSTGSGLMEAAERLARRQVGVTDLAGIADLPGWAVFWRTQALIGIDKRLAALTFRRWHDLYATQLGSFPELHDRGLSRRFLSDGRYWPSTLPRPQGRASLPAADQQARLDAAPLPGRLSRRQAILVLASRLHLSHPYAQWLAGLDRPLLVIAPATAALESGFAAHISVVDSWDDDAITEQALMLDRIYGIGVVIGLGEVDITVAARIREALDLPGQRPDSAEAYRDKYTMRQYAAAGGVAVPAFASAASAQDVVQFMSHHSGPVMVKPRVGGGSVGIRRVDTIADAEALGTWDDPGGYLVEEYVDGQTFHVDAIRVAGRTELAVPSGYIGAGCLAHWDDAPGGSWTLAPGNPLHAQLLKAADAVLDALPGPGDLLIHAEFFVDPDDEIVLCEVASRGAGIPIPDMLVRRLGVDMRELWLRAQCGLPVDFHAVRRHEASAALAANIGIPWRNGRIRALPSAPPPGVQDLTLCCGLGESFAGARYNSRRSGDFVATWVVTADSEPALLQRIASTTQQMEQAVQWDLAPAVADRAVPGAS